MRDGSTRRRSTSPQSAARLTDINQLSDWRRHGRLDDLRTLAEGAHGLTLSRGLLHALLEELHISDDFDVLVGRVAHLPASQYPRLLATAVLLRHSWCPQDLSRTAARLGLPRPAGGSPPLTSESPTPRPRTPPPRDHACVAPRAAYAPALKGEVMLNPSVSPSAPARGHRVRELVCAYRPLRDGDGRVVDVPTVVLKDPRTAAAVLAPLIADQPVEVFGVACLSTKNRLLAWHVLSRGTRASTPLDAGCLRARVSHTGHDWPDGRSQPSERRSHIRPRRCTTDVAPVCRGRRARHAAARPPDRR